METSQVVLWTVIALVGVGTFFLRSSFILAADKLKPPEWLSAALKFVPPAVLAALVSSGLLLDGDAIDISLENTRLLAGLIAGAVAWKTKSLLWTILSGMSALWLINQLITF